LEIVPGLHWVEGIWDSKVYVVLEQDRVVVVDSGMPGRGRSVFRFLASLGYPPQSVSEVWLTHGDLDHMGSVAALQAGSGAQIVAHHADVPIVEGRAERPLGQVPFRGFEHLFKAVMRGPGRYQPATVDRPVDDGERLGSWQVVHVPGHTPGSVCFFQPERGILITGDAVNHRRGRLGAPPKLFTSDMAQAHASIRKIAGLEFEICCFGHGPPLKENAKRRVQALASSL